MSDKVHYEYIKSMKLAALLMLDGFRILDIQKDKYKPEFDVYCFRQTKELTNAILKHIDSKNGGNNVNYISTNCTNNRY